MSSSSEDELSLVSVEEFHTADEVPNAATSLYHPSTKIINEDRKKVARINFRDQVKIEVQAEDVNAMKTLREMLKEECRDAHAMQNLHI